MDINLVKQKLAALQSRSSGGNKTDFAKILWKPTVGKQTIRIIPSAFNKKIPFKEVYFHYGIGKRRSMISLINFNEKDPIADFASSLREQGGKENWVLSKKLEPKMRIFVPIVVRGEEDMGVRLWEFGKEVYMELLSLGEDEDVGDYTDPVSGRDIVVETLSPDQTGRSYNKSSVRVKTKVTPLTEDSAQLKEWLSNQPNPLEIFKRYSYDELKSALMDWLNPEDAEEKDEEDVDDDISTNVEDKSSSKPASKYSLGNAKGKKTVDEKFDDLFSDDLPF